MLWHYSGIVVTKTNKWRIYEMVQQKRFGRSATVRITFKIDFCTENITASRYSEIETKRYIDLFSVLPHDSIAWMHHLKIE